jgi:hypothetical protein
VKLPRRQPVPGVIWRYLGITGAGVALIALFAILTVLTTRKEPDFRHFLLRTDFPAFLTGARLVAAGQGAALYDPAAQAPVQQAMLAPYGYERGLLPYNHLPFLALALAPFADLPLPIGYAVWLGATVLALLVALALLSRELRAAARTPVEARWAPRALWALGLGFFPVYQNLLQVQTAPWVLLGYTLLIRYLRQERQIAAGLGLALVLVKPQLLIVPVLLLLYTRRWRALAAFAGLAAGLSLLITPLLGGFGWIGSYLRLLGNVAGASSDNSTIQPVLMENLRGFFTLLAAHYDPAGLGTGNVSWVLPLTAVATVAVLAGLAWAWRGRAGAWAADPAGWDRRWAAAILAAPLVSPHTLPYELPIWILAGVLSWRGAREGTSPAPVLRTALLLAAGYIAGNLTLELILVLPGWPIHVGVLFALVAIVLLCAPAAHPAARKQESNIAAGASAGP